MNTGILLIDKPTDWTSHDVVAKLRGLYKERRIGHAGTLDPMATGLLTIFIGRATRAVPYLEDADKTYIAHLRPGVVTDTQDITGRVLEQTKQAITHGQLAAILPRFLGEIQQIPPMYSAVSIGGQRLYQLARAGKEVERKPRHITIHSIDLGQQLENGDYPLTVCASKGTYIRTLVHDMGQQLGCGATLSYLHRTHVGDFSVEDGVTLAQVETATDRHALLRPLDTIFGGLPAMELSIEQEQRLRQGQIFAVPQDTQSRLRLYGSAGGFFGLGAVHQGQLRVEKGFYAPNEQ